MISKESRLYLSHKNNKLLKHHKVQQYYFFPKIRYDILKFVKSCIICLSQKISNYSRLGLIGAEKPENFPFQIIAIDIMGPFPRSPRGFKYHLVVANWSLNTHNSVLCEMLVLTIYNLR